MRPATAQRRNKQRMNACGDAQFVPLIKVNTGIGLPTPGQMATNPALTPVGTAYPDHLSPESHRELDRMTLDQISRLAEWANDHFGILLLGISSTIAEESSSNSTYFIKSHFRVAPIDRGWLGENISDSGSDGRGKKQTRLSRPSAASSCYVAV
eukprot:scaffold373720_cov42-Attheya_sp.AAC.1